MKPIKLIIEGLYSYQSRQEIDFTKLTNTHLFGIFGSVGSGKSSILEALTFALYGKTDKLNSRDNRYYNMMNLKSNSLYIEFVFELEGDEYQVIVGSRRNKKDYQDVKIFTRDFYKKQLNEWVPIEETVVHGAIGLSYENFKRTIIIPQGQFKEFLELGDKDRTKMMKELFNLGKYDLQYKLKPLIARNETQMNRLKGQLEQLGDVNIEQMNELELSLTALIKEIELLNKELLLINKDVNELEALKVLKEKKLDIEKRISLLKIKAEEFKLLKDKITNYEYCFTHFSQDITEFDRASNSVKSIEEGLVVAIGEEKKLSAHLLDIKKSFEIIRKSFETKDDLLKRIDELIKIKQIFSLKIKGIEYSKDLQITEQELKEREKNLAKGKLFIEDLSIVIEKDKLQLADVIILNEIKDWYATDTNLNKDIKRIEAECVALDKELKVIVDEAFICSLNKDKSLSIKQQVLLLEKEKMDLSNSLKPINIKIDEYSVQQKLEEYASRLEDGRACPLCGSIEHPLVMNSQQVSSLLLKHREERNTIEKEVTVIEKSIVSLQKSQALFDSKQENLKTLRSRLDKCHIEYKTYSKTFKWDMYKTVKELDNSFADYKKSSTIISNNEKTLKAGQDKYALLLKQFDDKNKQLSNAQNIIKENIVKIDTLSSVLQILNMYDYTSKSEQEIENQCDEWKLLYRKIETDYKDQLTDIELNESKCNKLKGQIKANKEVLLNEKKSLSMVEKSLIHNLSNSKYEEIRDVRQLLKTKLDVSAERSRLDEYNKSVNATNAELEGVNRELKGKQYDVERHASLLIKVKEISEDRDQKNAQKGKFESLIEKLKKDLKQIKDLKTKEHELLLRANDLATMNSLFKASGFVNYVSSVHLQNLCNAANDRFYKLTGQKLSLEITEKNNFQIRDFMNGGNVRSVKTLSGGQSFQASLSLALALTDSIQKFTKSKQNFFFLDEGFGSLDKDSLTVVFEALKSLKKENRVVGVISHVEELQQEMGVYLEVVNDSERGSELRFSWD